MHPTVLRAWVEGSGKDERDIRVIRANHTDGREVFFVMARQPRRFPGQTARVLSTIGGTRFDFSDPLIFPAADGTNVIGADFWQALGDEIRTGRASGFDRIEFPRLRDDTLGGYIPNDDQPELCPYMDIAPFDSMDAYIASRSGHRRQNLRRRLRKAREAGDFAFQIVGADQLDRILSWIPKIIAQKRRKFTADTTMDGFETFLTGLVQEAVPAGYLVCSCCTLDGQDISWSLDFLIGDEFLQYVADYDPDFRDLAPGTTHKYSQFEWLIANNVKGYNFMWGDEEYKREWTDGDTRKLYRIRFDRDWPPSRLRLSADRAYRHYLRSRDKQRAEADNGRAAQPAGEQA